MSFNYKDLLYIRALLQHYESALAEENSSEFSEVKDDILYIARLISLTDYKIEGLELEASRKNSRALRQNPASRILKIVTV